MKYKKEQIFNQLRKERDFLNKSGVSRIGLFGSTARGNDREKSDLDFLIEMKSPTFDGYMDVKLRLEDLFHRRVDLVLSHRIKPRLREKILAETIYAPGL
ncbi:MAG TPA: nucleotidyltransferase family protein [bacterium]|nr:nucleotidyltransferase family protein [bacterium]